MEEIKNKLIEFITENGLNFVGSGSELNSDCTIISGYALHLGARNNNVILEAIHKATGLPEAAVKSELDTVFDYAQSNGYASYWSGSEAKTLYHF